MADYCTDEQLAHWLNIADTDSEDATRLTFAVDGAKSAINKHVGRNFDSDAAATARYFRPLDTGQCLIDDAWSITSVATDVADDGTWSTAWVAGDWIGEPVGGVSFTGELGWPFTSIRAVEARSFASCTARPFVKVTAKWGWAAVPADITLAALIYGAELFKLHEAPLGTAWTGESDLVIRNNRPLRDLLQPYKKLKSSGDSRFMVA